MSWISLCEGDGCEHAIHEVDEFEGVKGGAVSRWEIDENHGGYVRREWVSVGAGEIDILPDASSGG